MKYQHQTFGRNVSRESAKISFSKLTPEIIACNLTDSNRNSKNRIVTPMRPPTETDYLAQPLSVNMITAYC